jgi:hypothetical protein
VNCESTKDLLVLLNYGELSFDEEEALLSHLDSCRSCAAERRRIEKLDALLELQRPAPPAGLLSRCRRDLGAQVAEEMPGRNWLHMAGWWRSVTAMAWLKPAAAIALLAVGFVGGREIRSAGASPVAFMPLHETPAAGKVQLADNVPGGRAGSIYEETRPRGVLGDPNDAGVRGLLLAAVNDQDPALRIDSIDLLRSRCNDETVRQALLRALRTDRYSGVRLKALDALRPYARDPETRSTLAEVLLNDPSPAMRTQAIDLLVQSRGADVASTLQEVLRHEDNSYIRERSVNALRAMKASAGTF